MANVKTAISLGESLFARADTLARQLQVSRSELFSRAMSEFLERRESRILLDAINRAVEDAPLDEEERRALRSMKHRQRELPGSEW
jgi:metal-responsive CopG/Arc/MetJ family transcriptional regulator